MTNAFGVVNKLKNLPDQPGIYQFYDARGGLLYIGKAKSLKKRVSSYFTKTQHDGKTDELVKRIAVEVITTKNEVEAFLLEASLIKKNQPPYNIDLKGGSGRYAYLKITSEPFPRIVTVRNQADLEQARKRGEKRIFERSAGFHVFFYEVRENLGVCF